MRRGQMIIGLVALTLASLAVGGLWAAIAPQAKRQEKITAELNRLRESEAKTRPRTATAAAPALCRALAVKRTGEVTDEDLNELSGLVASRRTPGLFWGIEDSGNPPILSALRADGSLAGNWTIPGATNVDWEDVATGPGPSGPVLYAADIGDNLAKRESIVIYRVPEPSSPAGGGQTAPGDRITLKYPDGAHDAESLTIDPIRGTLLITTKELGGGVYALSKPLPFGGTATLRKVTAAALPFATASDVSADGHIFALRGYFSLDVWVRRGHEPLTTTLKRQPCTSPTGFKDGQGEAIALSSHGTTALSVAEGVEPPLFHYAAKTG